MNKLFTKIATLSVGLALAIGVGVAVGSNSKEASPVHAASWATTTSLSAGDVVVIGGSGYEMTSVTTSGTTYGAVTAVSNNTPAGTYSLTVEAGSSSGSFSFKNSSGNYLSWSSGNSLTTSGTKNNASSWTIVNASTKLMLQNVGTTARHMSFNSSASPKRIACYGNTGQNALVIWKRSATLVTSVTLNKSSTTITAGGSETLTATVLPNTADDKTLTWSVSPSGQGVTVSNGTVSTTAQATPGQYTVTATANDGSGKAGSCTVTVASAAAESITVTSSSSSLYVGESDITLTATPSNFSPTTYTWSSSNTSVATISGTGTTGTLHALTKGETNITASATGSNGTVTSNSYKVTVKQFSIALSTASVSMKASKSTTVTVTPTDANGTVVVTAQSNNTSVATTSVSGTTITITSGSEGGTSTTITVSAKDNNGASGYHTAANKTISVEVTAGYVVGNKITALPSSDKFVFLGNAAKTSWVGGTGTSAPETTNDEQAALFVYSTTGTLRYYNQETEQSGNYIYNGGTNTTVSLSSDSAVWASGLGDTDYPGLLQLTGGRFLLFNGGVAKAYATANKTAANAPYFIYAYEAVASTPTVALSGDSVSGMKGDSNTSLTLTISNFTATGLNVTYKDDGESSFSASSDVATVSCGHSTGSNTVSVSFDGVGSTTVKLSVTRGSGDPIEKTFTVSVSPKPASITINNTLKDGYLEVRNSNSASTYGYQQLDITALDTEGNAYEGQLDYTVESGDSYIGLSDAHRVYGKAVGTGVVKVSAHALSSVYAEVNVKSMDDTKTGVKSVTFNSSLTAYAGDALSISNVIATKKAYSYFGYSEGLDIDDSELLFSYSEHDYENAVPAASFIYACDEETAVDDSENQTVYVYCTLDSTWSSSFSITVTQTSNPVEGVAISNVSAHAKTITRTDSFQLALTFTPSNATNKNVTYSLSNESTGSTITVSQTGLVSAGTRAGSTARVTVTTEDGGFTDYVNITVSMDEMAYTIREEASYTKISSTSELVSGDYLIVYEDGSDSIVMDGGASTIDSSSSKITGVSISDDTIESTEELDAATFHYDATATTLYSSSGLYMGRTADTNGIDTNASTQYTNTITFDEGNAIIKGSGNAVLRYNSSDARFRYYKSSTYSAQKAVSLYLKSGGDSEITVDATLLNAILDNFGAGKTYEWSDSCPAFDEDAWLDACIALTEITNYSSYKLNRAVGNIAGNEVEQFIAKYDIIIGKFGKVHDHLDRYTEGGIHYNQRIDNPINIVQSGNTALIIVLVSVVSAAAIGGYFFLRKKKED